MRRNKKYIDKIIMKNVAFWDVAPCSLVVRYKRFCGAHCYNVRL